MGENTYQKRQTKNPIKFKITLSDEQKEAKDQILNNTITILKGAAGSGKTLLACQVALDLLFRNLVEKIVIVRPAVSIEDLGFFKGSIEDKITPWLIPVISNMNDLYSKDKIKKLFEEEKIEIVPLMLFRGRTFNNSVIVVDEAQNITMDNSHTSMTRIGENCKLIMLGDTNQIDITNKSDSSLKHLIKMFNNTENIGVVEMSNADKNVRNPLIDVIENKFDEYFKEKRK